MPPLLASAAFAVPSALLVFSLLVLFLRRNGLLRGNGLLVMRPEALRASAPSVRSKAVLCSSSMLHNAHPRMADAGLPADLYDAEASGDLVACGVPHMECRVRVRRGDSGAVVERLCSVCLN
jgi:hypothetical protein